MGRFMSKSKGSVIEKIRTDFNASKKEHVVTLTRLPPMSSQPARPGAHAIDPTIWAELLMRLKEGVASTFTSTVDAQQDEIRRCELGRGQGQWDFCSHFLAKDALAQTLEGVGLKEDAVAQYEDLENVFEQALLGGHVSFAPVGGDARGDDSLPLLEATAKKPYHELIRRREITLFDFRCYLFARRASLLGKLGRVVQVMREAPLFIGAMRRMLRSNARVDRRMVESWSFSAALDVVEQCQAWLVERGDLSTAGGPGGGGPARSRLEGRLAMAVTAGGPTSSTSTLVEEQLSPIFHTAKADLLDLARRQLDKLGMAVGHLPGVEPFSLSADDEGVLGPCARDLPPLPPGAEAEAEAEAGLGADPDGKAADDVRYPQITRPELRQAIEDRELFDSHYVSLVERIAAGLRGGGRKGGVLRMQTLLAALDFHRQRFDKAYAALVSLTELYHEQRSSPIEGHLLARQLECHRQLGKPRDRAWVSVIRAALRAGQGDRGRPLIDASQLDVAQADDVRRIELWQDPRFLLQELRQAASTFDKEVPVAGNPSFAIRPISRRARLAEVEDGSTIRVAVASSLGFDLFVDDVRLCFVGPNKQALWFTTGRTTLRPGVTHLELFCSTPAHGTFALDVSQIRLARLIFQYASPAASIAASVAASGAHGPLPPAQASLQQQPSGFLLAIPKDGGAIDVDAGLPHEIHLDRPREVEVALHSGRNHIESAEISITTAEGEVVGDVAQAQLVGHSSGSARIDSHSGSGADGDSSAHARPAGRDAIRLVDQAPRTVVRLRLPLVAKSQDGGMDLVIAVQYVVRPAEGARTNARRTLRKHCRLTISLPLGVNLQDFFRASSLFSKFVISTGGTGSLRIRSARLAVDRLGRGEGEEESSSDDADQLEVSACGTMQTTTVTPRQPASYLFRIQRRHEGSTAAAATGEATSAQHRPRRPARRLRLELRYRPLNDEAKAIAQSALAHQISTSAAQHQGLLGPDSPARTLLERALAEYVDAKLDLPAFSLTGEARTGAFDAAWWRRQRATWPDDGGGGREAVRVAAATLQVIAAADAATVDAVGDGIATTRAVPSGEPHGSSDAAAAAAAAPQPWRLLTIPVDVPSMSIVNSVTLRIDDKQPAAQPCPRPGFQATIVVGRPVDVEVSISTSFHWGYDDEDDDDGDDARGAQPTSQRFTYDVSADFECWLVSGLKRCAFSVPRPPRPSSSSSPALPRETKFTVQLIPLRPGCLTLPSVVVRPVGPALSRTPRSAVTLSPADPPPPDDLHNGGIGDGAQPSCETHTVNSAERVEVVPRLTRSTFWLDTTHLDVDGGGPAEAWEVGGTRRVDELFA
ncbi:uncharacterized protein PFL1_02691 [Pseudozyma flocculosa PF-1]|nr:uncharacterized protein PFL1_02691 [Pseudozyma flocculosa PF-1]EPQ30018.1 hypothetical protein PFL1_02691 [Pseudozyma flocculosa PF-1]